VVYYGSFEKFLNGILKAKEKEVIDIEKLYKKKQDVLLDLNSSKLSSPIILIDPTYKQRNALAALSNETLNKFKKYSREFLKNPSIKYFEEQNIDLEQIKEKAKIEKNEIAIFEISTKKQEGDVAGSKLLKFYNNCSSEISRFYNVKEKGFTYNGKQKARFFLVLKNKEEIIFNGPSKEEKEGILKFKKAHKKVEMRDGKLFAKEKFNLKIKDFFNIWKKKNSRKIKEMYLESIELKQ
jgi:tRNA nucleotidyltransferase (CCA-adding enzyme)